MNRYKIVIMDVGVLYMCLLMKYAYVQSITYIVTHILYLLFLAAHTALKWSFAVSLCQL